MEDMFFFSISSWCQRIRGYQIAELCIVFCRGATMLLRERRKKGSRELEVLLLLLLLLLLFIVHFHAVVAVVGWSETNKIMNHYLYVY